MKFTKPYIKECDCEEIQNLRKDYWVYGDYISLDGQKPRLILTEVENILGDEIFIPRSDQLDEEIIKICKKKEYIYSIHWNLSGYHFFQLSLDGKNITNQFDFNDINPCMAKIKLLKKLLNEKYNLC